MMDNFEQKLINDIQCKILSDIKKTTLIDFPYNERIKVSRDLVQKAYSQVDQEKIINYVKEAIEEQIAKKIVNSLLTEVGTDTKHLMSDNVLREQLKYRVYPKIMALLSEVKNGQGSL